MTALTVSAPRTAPGRHAVLPPPTIIRRRVTDAWPTGVRPIIGLLRGVGEDTPMRLFEEMQQHGFRPLQAQSPNTQRAYAADWRVFVRFCEYAGFCPLPAAPAALEAFIEYSLPEPEDGHTIRYQYVPAGTPRRNVKVATLERALYAIGTVHTWLQWPNPAAHPDVAHTLSINVRGRAGATPKEPVTHEQLQQALPSYGSSLKEMRAKALLTLQWSSGTRRSEVARVRVEDLKLPRDRPDGTLRVPKSKGDKRGKGAYLYVSPEARKHVTAWLQAADITTGPVFRRLNRAGRIAQPRDGAPKALHANEVAREWKKLMARILCTGAEAPEERQRLLAPYSGHSPRIGATHTLHKLGYTNAQIQHVMRWKNEQMIQLYIREQQVYDSAMAQYFAALRLQ